MHAIGQGALAVECRTDDKKILDMLKPLNDKATVQAVMAERALMRTLVCLRKFTNYLKVYSAFNVQLSCAP